MFSFFFLTRVAIVVAYLWVLFNAPNSNGGHLVGFMAGMALLSLVSDEVIRRWFTLPEPPIVMRVPNHDGHSADLDCYVGSKEQFSEHFNDTVDSECILMAACRHSKTGQIWAVERPGRHHHVLWAMDIMKVAQSDLSGDQEGFLTNWGRFVDRRAAALIASAAGQLLDKQTTPVQLYSEDLWTNKGGLANAA